MAIGSAAARLIDNDPWVRLTADAEAVHHARVATRRLRSDLKTLEPLLASERVAWLRRELAWIGRALGTVRDADVLLSRIDDTTSRIHEAPEAVARVVMAVQDDRAARHAELVELFESSRYRSLVEALVEACESPPLAASVEGGTRARPTLRRLVRKSYRRLERAVKRLDPEPSDADLHEIRKRAKRARYAAELATGTLGKDAKRLAKRLEALQAGLGDIQDAVQAESRLRWLGSHRLTDGAAFAAGVLACGEREQVEDGRRRWRPLWKAVRRRRP